MSATEGAEHAQASSTEVALAFDVGQSGARVVRTSDGVRVDGPQGLRPLTGLDDVEALAAALARLAARLPAGPVAPVRAAIGTTGFPAEPDLRRALLERLRAALGIREVTVVSDAVTALIGTIGEEPGVAFVWGTGAVALGHDGEGRVVRVDGRGHLLGDHGSGFRIGQAGLQLALDHLEGRADAPGLAGAYDALGWGDPHRAYEHVHGAAVPAATVAAFAPAVVALAESGDGPALDVLERAADDAARTCVAAGRGSGAGTARVGITGGIARSVLARELLAAALVRHGGASELVHHDDAALAGAILLARRPSLAAPFGALSVTEP